MINDQRRAYETAKSKPNTRIYEIAEIVDKAWSTMNQEAYEYGMVLDNADGAENIIGHMFAYVCESNGLNWRNMV